jgi:tetratricopeptide (TPR) repeat protein
MELPLEKLLNIGACGHDEAGSICSLEETLVDDNEYYIHSLLSEGEMSLLKGHFSAGMAIFDKVAKLDPSNPRVFFQQGLSLFEYGNEEGREKALLLAGKKFKMAASLNPGHFETWQAWGNALSLLGATFREHHYFIEAEEKYRKALALSENQSSEILAELHWDYGIVYSHLAQHSGEALDLQLTLDSFQKASSSQDNLPSEFWNDFGNASLDLAARINDIRLYVKAINCFKHAISTAISCYEGWVYLAKALQMLYDHTHDEDHFSQANECFAAAAQLRPQNAELWLNWAKFLCESGRRNQDAKRLRSCIEKCHRAYACDHDCAYVLAIWAEALALLGDLSDRLDLIYESQNKISEAAQKTRDAPDIWFSYGICLSCFGHYFNDFDYYYQAIEKFQYGLSLDRTNDRLWHAIASAYAIIGHLEIDVEAFERSCRFYTKAIDLKASSYYIFDHALALSKLGEMSHDQKWVEQAVSQFERALNLQKNAVYIHPEWLFQYACALDTLGDFYEEDFYYLRTVEILSHVLMIDPDFPQVHHRLALAFSHLGELLGEIDHFYRAIHHFRLASKHDEENDQIILDWGLTLINIAQHSPDSTEADQLYREAEHKITQSARLGNLHAYYHLGCLYSIMGQYEKAMRFIEKADEFESLPPLDEIHQDDWLDGLRSTIDFREFLAQLEKRPNLQEER